MIGRYRSVVVAVAATGVLTGVCGAADIHRIAIDPEERGLDIAPTLLGVFLEDINHAIDGGLYAEMIQNGSFDFPYDWIGWHPFGKVSLEREGGLFPRCPKYARIYSTGGKMSRSGLQNTGIGRGMYFAKDARYRLSFWARTKDPKSVRLDVFLSDQYAFRPNRNLAAASVAVEGTSWRKYVVSLKADAESETGVVNIMLEDGSAVDIDSVSLFPEDTWKGGVLRRDLVEALADLKPKVLRFPGGCVVEGNLISGPYDWKSSVGPVENRPPVPNMWQCQFKQFITADYYQTYGVGFFEHFILAEQLGAEPIPVVNCGLLCQIELGRTGQSAKGDLAYMDKYVQDALDLVEFANGSVTSFWGRVRAEMGHSAPFGVKYIGIGNEQLETKDDPIYTRRFEMIWRALREKHPEIEVMGSVMDVNGLEVARLREMKVPWIDEHWYLPPDWVKDNGLRFDGYDRCGPKIYAGEYACHDWKNPCITNFFVHALCEAAFVTTMERNADIVKMSSYGELFTNLDGWQFMPTLIWFDRKGLVKTCKYEVQKLCADHQGVRSVRALCDGLPLAGQKTFSRLFVSAVIDARDTLVVKCVNVEDDPAVVLFEIRGGDRGGRRVTYCDERLGECAVSSSGDKHDLPPRSFSIFTFPKHK